MGSRFWLGPLANGSLFRCCRDCTGFAPLEKSLGVMKLNGLLSKSLKWVFTRAVSTFLPGCELNSLSA